MKYSYKNCKFNIGLAIWSIVFFYLSAFYIVVNVKEADLFGVVIHTIGMFIQGAVFISQIYFIGQFREIQPCVECYDLEPTIIPREDYEGVPVIPTISARSDSE